MEASYFRDLGLTCGASNKRLEIFRLLIRKDLNSATKKMTPLVIDPPKTRKSSFERLREGKRDR